MSTSLEREIKDTITCHICSETFTNPKTLPCMHTYCYSCLGELVVMETESKDTVKCPECSQVHVLPIKGLEDFNVCYTIGRLIDIFKAANMCDYKPQCDICEDVHNLKTDAVVSCSDCGKNLCSKCEIYHKEFLQGHTTIELTGDRAKDLQRALETVKDHTIYCESHHIPLQIYCKVDQCALCPTCYIIDHSGHSCTELHKAAQTNIQQINDLLRHGEKRLKHYENAIEDTHQYKENIEEDMHNATAELTKEMDMAIQIIHDKYNKAIMDINLKRDECQTQTSAHIDELELQKSLIEATMNRLRTMKDYGHEAELVNMCISSEIDSKFKEWSKIPQVHFEQKTRLKVHKEVFEIMFGCVDVENYYDVPNESMSTKSCFW